MYGSYRKIKTGLSLSLENCVVALFFGKAKSNSAESFLGDFIKEFQQSNKDGFVCSDCASNTNLPVTLHSVVADAPANINIK